MVNVKFEMCGATGRRDAELTYDVVVGVFKIGLYVATDRGQEMIIM